jgi:hypothetical protein
MAARRLLIVMLILLGLSTLAAALIPQRTLRDGSATRSTTTTTTTTAPTPEPVGRSLSAPIVVGGKKIPVVAGPVCRKSEPKCEPAIHVGDRLSLQVFTSAGQALVQIPEFGLLGVAAQNSPALFDLLPQQVGTIGILFASTNKVAARIQVLSVKDAKAEARRTNAKRKRRAKRRARAGSGRS